MAQEVPELAQRSASAAKEINSAVNQMDQVTQQNAPMVEETTAASVTLKALVTRFRASHGTQDKATALRATAQQMRAPAPARRAPSTPPARKAQPQTQGANALARDDWEEF
ncbi:hypothetical protein HB780_28215 [Rhizobium lusitanum]|nr:hypothetical protein HB780_28215 [Rhizobium lusitanum]